MEKLAILLLKRRGNHVALGWEMVGDDDLKSWEMVGILLIPEVWKPWFYVVLMFNNLLQLFSFLYVFDILFCFYTFNANMFC